MVSSPLTTELALLGFLRQQPMHGYEIHRRLSASKGIGLVWRVKQNQLYALLAKMERKHYVITKLEPQGSRPPRKVFHLTDTGREVFLAWVQSPVKRGHELRLDFMSKLYFAQREGQEVTKQLIEQQRNLCQRWLSKQRSQAEALKGHKPYDWLVHQFRVGQIEAMLNWLDICEAALPDLKEIAQERNYP